ncbi:MAG: PD-(D/E)XK nuclease family protein [Acidimicrobiia bacterium]
MPSDRPYLVERPDALRRRWEGCPVSGLEPTRAPAWQLERWKVVRDLIVGWYGDPRPDTESVPDLIAERAGWLDPVQRLFVERLFAGWRAMFPKEPGVVVDMDPPTSSVFDHDRAVELKVAATFGFTRPDGSVERVRLKTGRHPSGRDDAAVIHAALTDDGGDVVYLDALVGVGVADEIVAPPEADRRLTELVELAARNRRVARVAGPQCFSCSSAPRCGQYPPTGRVYVSTRSLTVSKTQLGWLATCRRRVAWDRLHQLRIEEDADIELSRGLAMGNLFHQTAAAAILSDDPEGVVVDACATVAPSEAAELRRLWENHCSLWGSDRLEARATEYSAGLTVMAPGPQYDARGRKSVQPVAITMIGVLDVTGRESDGTPMVVEHRTGSAPDHGHLELDLYAVSVAEAVKRRSGEWPAKLAVHLHLLGPSQPECRRTEFDHARLQESFAGLERAAAEIARWDPHNSLDPGFSVGQWCGGCRHRPLCEQFR